MPPTRPDDAQPAPPRIGGPEALALEHQLELRAGAALAGIAAHCHDTGNGRLILLRAVVHSRALGFAQHEQSAARRLVRYLEVVGQLTASARDASLVVYDAHGILTPLLNAPAFADSGLYLKAWREGDSVAAIKAASAITAQDVHFGDHAWVDREATAALRLP